MSDERWLVVYFSRSGNTEVVARAIAGATGARIEALRDTVERGGTMGFLRSMKDAFTHGHTTLAPLEVDPSDYDLVIVGTPDWGGGVSAPVRTFLEAHRGRIRAVAFFLTDGTADHAKVFREMSALAGLEPRACLGIPGADAQRAAEDGRVRDFVREIRKGSVGICAPQR